MKYLRLNYTTGVVTKTNVLVGGSVNTIIAEFIWCDTEYVIDFKHWVSNDEAITIMDMYKQYKDYNMYDDVGDKDLDGADEAFMDRDFNESIDPWLDLESIPF